MWTVGLFATMFFLFNDSARAEIYTLSLHDALPIWRPFRECLTASRAAGSWIPGAARGGWGSNYLLPERSEEHTSELQSHHELVCRLLLEKKKDESRPVPKKAFSIESVTVGSQPLKR